MCNIPHLADNHESCHTTEPNSAHGSLSTDLQEENTPNPQDEYRVVANESLMICNKVYEISPGEDCATKNILLDKHCEQLAFPSLFSDGNYGYTHNRQIFLNLSQYINQRLLKFSQAFARNIDYIFWAQTLLQQKFFREKISLAMRKKLEFLMP